MFRISSNVGRGGDRTSSRNALGIPIGLDTIKSSTDIMASSSAAQSDMRGRSWGDVSGVKIHGFADEETESIFRVIIAL